MMNAVGIGLIGAGILSYLFPGFNGIFFTPSDMTAWGGQMLGAVLFIGGCIIVILSRWKQS